MARTDLNSLRTLFEAELKTDHFFDDLTTACLKEKGQQPGKSLVMAKEAGVFSGEAVIKVAKQILPQMEFVSNLKEGGKFLKGSTLLEITGKIGELLSLERTLLNFLGHACGVATLTNQFVAALSSPSVKILATRKTLPGLKDLELEAVIAGGGHIHRRSLSDGILFKDNHIALSCEKDLLANAEHIRSPLHRVEIEVQNLEQLSEVLKYSPDIIMLDNMTVSEMKTAIVQIREKLSSRCAIEISGGVTLERIPELSALGINYISVGKITHSAPWLNLSMDFH